MCNILLITLLLVTFLVRLSASAQCVATNCPSGHTFDCEATCWEELVAAINSGTCNPVVVPAGVTINVPSTISLGSTRNGLRLNIAGTLRWVGSAGGSQRLFNVGGDATDIVIDGLETGLITSCYQACLVNTGCGADPPDCRTQIAYAFRVTNCSDITVRNLNVTEMSGILKNEFAPAYDIEINNVHAQRISDYGIFFGASEPDPKGRTLKIQNCSVDCVNGEYGYRLYSHQMDIESTVAEHVRDGGIWVVEGDDVELVDFRTDDYMKIGPNFACGTPPTYEGGGGPDRGQRVRGALIRVVGEPEAPFPMYIEIEPGTLGCYLLGVQTQDIGSQGLRLGRPPGTTTTYRPWNSIRWDDLTNTTVIRHNITGCKGPNIGKCAGDANFNEVVNIDDLLVVIGGWGGCAALGTCCYNNVCHRDITQATCQSLGGTWYAVSPQSPYDNSFELCQDAEICVVAASCNQACFLLPDTCSGDVAPPQRGDRVVGIDDLLQVISNWGCNIAGGPAPDYPETLNECFNTYCAGLQGLQWQECMDKCALAVCEKHPEQCD